MQAMIAHRQVTPCKGCKTPLQGILLAAALSEGLVGQGLQVPGLTLRAWSMAASPGPSTLKLQPPPARCRSSSLEAGVCRCLLSRGTRRGMRWVKTSFTAGRCCPYTIEGESELMQVTGPC